MTSFDLKADLIIVQARIFNPTDDTIVRLALDTGATETVINQRTLAHMGYDLLNPVSKSRVRTASGVETVPRINLTKLEALEQSRSNFSVLALRLPSTDIDGLLGLDFIRGQDLTISFRQGTLTLI